MKPSREHTPPIHTGIKTVDAVLYTFDYLFSTAKRDRWVFTFLCLLLIAVAGWGLYVRESQNADNRVEIARREEREMCQREMTELKNDISELQTRYINLENDFKTAEKQGNEAISKLYERMLQNKN